MGAALLPGCFHGKIPNFFVNLWTKSQGTAKTFQSA